MTLELLMALVGHVEKLIPYVTAIVNAKTVREKVLAVYYACKEVSALTPTPMDDSVVRFIDGQPGRLDVMVDLIVDGLDLIGFEDGEDRVGPFGSVSSDDTEKLRAALDAKAKTYGVSVFTLISAIRAVKLIIETAPVVVDGIRNLFPRLFDGDRNGDIVTPTVND